MSDQPPPLSAVPATQSTPRFSVGDAVIVSNPDDFVADVRNKVKGGRVGRVVHSVSGKSVFVLFPQVGRRREFKHSFQARWLSPAPSEAAVPAIELPQG